jgi:hypothetical protein
MPLSSSSSSPGSGNWGMTSEPTVWGFAMVILVAVLALALLRHLFGSIRVDFAAGTH